MGEGKCERVSDKYGLPGGFPSAIAVDRAGTVWVKMPSGWLFYLPRAVPGSSAVRMATVRSETSLISMRGQTARFGCPTRRGFVGCQKMVIPPGRLPAVLPEYPDTNDLGISPSMPTGRSGPQAARGFNRFPQASELPIGVSVDPASGQSFTIGQGLSSDVVWRFLVDRECSLWVGTNSGLDQLRPNVVSQLAIPATNEHQLAVAAGDHGCVWIGSRSLPLTEVCPDGTGKTFVETRQAIAIRRDFKGGVWSSGLGENHLWRASSKGLEPIHFPHDDVEVPASATVDKNNNIWILSFGLNVYRSAGPNWENLNQVLGREPGVLGAMEGDQTGNVWFAFSNHVIEWDGTGYRRYNYTGKNRYPTCLMAKGAHVWLGADDGVQLLTQGEFHMMRWKDPSLPGRVSGIVGNGNRRSLDQWIFRGSRTSRLASFENGCGIRLTPYRQKTSIRWTGFPVSQQRDTLYHQSLKPATVVCGLPRLEELRGSIRRPSIKPMSQRLRPCLISSLVWDGKTHSDLRNLVIPPQTGSIEIDYTALSLAIPERVLFRYRLDGVDKKWQDAGTRRQAYYTKLHPRTYKFRVIACNDHGVWNTSGAFLSFKVIPAVVSDYLVSLLDRTSPACADLNDCHLEKPPGSR